MTPIQAIMYLWLSSVTVLLVFGASSTGTVSAAMMMSKENDFGYVTVREGAHMFYWLYYTKAQVKRYVERPLVLWLQGGPGASSTGHGNFEEIGPFDVNLNERNFSWTRDLNVLFIDNPVGAGFSFVDNLKLLTTNNKQIADDLIVFMRIFMGKHPEFQTVPLYIFSESYGGKMAIEFSLELYETVQNGLLKCNPKAVVLGDPWISPIESMLSWAPFLFNNVSECQSGGRQTDRMDSFSRGSDRRNDNINIFLGGCGQKRICGNYECDPAGTGRLPAGSLQRGYNALGPHREYHPAVHVWHRLLQHLETDPVFPEEQTDATYSIHHD